MVLFRPARSRATTSTTSGRSSSRRAALRRASSRRGCCVRRGRTFAAFLASSATIALLLISGGDRALPEPHHLDDRPGLQPDRSTNAASADNTLEVALIVALIGMPFVLLVHGRRLLHLPRQGDGRHGRLLGDVERRRRTDHRLTMRPLPGARRPRGRAARPRARGRLRGWPSGRRRRRPAASSPRPGLLSLVVAGVVVEGAPLATATLPCIAGLAALAVAARAAACSAARSWPSAPRPPQARLCDRT